MNGLFATQDGLFGSPSGLFTHKMGLFSSANGLFGPRFSSSGILAHYKFTDSSYVNLAGSAIFRALDITGNGYDTFVQQNATFRPTYALNQINGLPASTYDGGDNLLLPPSLFEVTNGNNTIITVAKRNTETAAQNAITTAVQIGVRRTLHLTFSATPGSVIYRNNATNTDVTFTGATNTDYQVIVGRHSGTTQGINVNSGAEVTNSGGANTNVTNGWQIGDSNGGTFLTGGIVELQIYDYGLSSAQIAAIRSELYAEYNLPSINSWLTWDGSKDGTFTPITNSQDIFGIAKFDTDRSLALYRDPMTSQVYAIVATTSDTSVTYPASPQIIDAVVLYQATAIALDTNRVLVCYITAVGIYAVVVSIDGSNNITINTPGLIYAGIATAAPRILKLAADQCILTYADNSVVDTFSATIITTTGTSVDAPHAITEIDAYYPYVYNISLLSATSAFVVYSSDELGNGANGIILTIASNTVSVFSPHSLVSSSISASGLLSCQALDSTHAVVVYSDDLAPLSEAFVVTITDSSGNMSAGSSTTFYNGGAIGNQNGTSNPLCFIDSGTLMVLFLSGNLGLACVLSINSTTITPKNVVTLANQLYSGLSGVLLDANRILSGGYLAPTGGTQVLSIV